MKLFIDFISPTVLQQKDSIFDYKVLTQTSLRGRLGEGRRLTSSCTTSSTRTPRMLNPKANLFEERAVGLQIYLMLPGHLPCIPHAFCSFRTYPLSSSRTSSICLLHEVSGSSASVQCFIWHLQFDSPGKYSLISNRSFLGTSCSVSANVPFHVAGLEQEFFMGKKQKHH